MRLVFLIALLFAFSLLSYSQNGWDQRLDSKVAFYQTTDFGIVLAGTERSLYAIDGRTGETIWRRGTGKINETAITPVPDTDLVLLSRDLGNRSRLEAVDLISGASIWESDKVKGDVMQLAIDPASDLLAVVLVKDPTDESGKEMKRTPVIHMMRLSDGSELWKRPLDSDIEMMPARFGEGLGKIAFTLDNYRAPMIIDGRLFLFYEGATSYDAATGREKGRERFKVNESGLALTEADPVFDDAKVYISGRGKVRAVNRRTGEVEWNADDLGIASEMAVVGNVLYVRTGGQFTRLKDGEIVSKGPYGVSAVDTRDGNTIWRYKAADKGLTNFVFSDARTILIADRDDVIAIDADTGKARDKFEHKVEQAQFIILNERGHAVIGGRDELAAFDIGSVPSRSAAIHDRGTFSTASFDGSRRAEPREVWRVRHKAPGLGALRIITGIALRAAALYFRYGGLATSAIGLARGGLSLAGTINSFRSSGLRTRFGAFDLTTLAGNAARNYAVNRIYSFGSLARTPSVIGRLSGFQVITPSTLRSRLIRGAGERLIPSRADVQESILDRLDPVRYAERLSDYLLRRKRLAELRGSHMYFYTELPKPFDRTGLIGVNIHTGRDARQIRISDPDRQFVTDETLNLLYSSDGNRLQAYPIMNN
jgi:outer membrane protein assembly factor BamB